MEKVKVYLDEALNAFVVCGSCGTSRGMSFAGREVPHASLVKCKCGNTFVVTFDKRQYYRKPLDISGECIVEANSTEGIPIRMVDISVVGVQFQKLGGPAFHLDQKLKVAFRLTEKLVNLDVCVRSIRGDNIGAQIVSIDTNSKKIIGFYLMP